MERVGFACAYTPIALVRAAGFQPFRVLPLGEAPDLAGSLLHDNLCPHVKRLLDRALSGDLPPMAGMVFMNSCDAMRRLADAWRLARPNDRVWTVDLPTTSDPLAVTFFAGELTRLAAELSAWGGKPVTEATLAEAAGEYCRLAQGVRRVARRAATGQLAGGRSTLQALVNAAVTEPPEEVAAEVARIEATPERVPPAGAVPVYLFGNVFPSPDAVDLLEAFGARVVEDDLCTGMRQVAAFECGAMGGGFHALAKELLTQVTCARTVNPEEPQGLARRLVDGARAVNARAAIAQVMKFCDPYLARMPAIREAFAARGIPLLVLEGDCTLRSLGQQRTRVEAFVEMLGGSPR